MATVKGELTAQQARVCVTGHDRNRPNPFQGMGDFIGWAEAIDRLPNGDILLAHSAGWGHVSWASPRMLKSDPKGPDGEPMADYEAPTGGRSMACRSADGGRTWSRPVTVIDHRLDDRPDGLLVCRDGTVLYCVNVKASWSGFPEAPPPFAGDLTGLNDQQLVLRSEDGGQTWSEPIWIDCPGTFYERAHGRPIQLRDGAILWPTYCENVGGPESGGDGKLMGAIHRSVDSGKSWETWSTIHRDGVDVDEPAIAELPDGRLIMVCRPDGGVLLSEEQGKSWVDSGRRMTSTYPPTLRAPQLFVLTDGTVVALATWAVAEHPDPHLRGWISTDGGASWSNDVGLDTSCYGYPGGFLMRDDSIMISYCESARSPNRVYAARLRVTADRNGFEFLPIDAPE